MKAPLQLRPLSASVPARTPARRVETDEPREEIGADLGAAELGEIEGRAATLGHRAESLRVEPGRALRPRARLAAAPVLARQPAGATRAALAGSTRSARAAREMRPAGSAPSAGSAASAVGPSPRMPIQGRFDWKQKLAGGLGLAGAAAGIAGLTLGLPLLAGAGALAAAGGLAYGAYRGYQSYRANQRRNERDRREADEGRQAEEGRGLLAGSRQQAPDVAIPNRMHFIWVGGQVPEERRRNVQAWRERAPGVEPHLWLDDNSAHASAEHLDELRRSGVQIRNVSEIGSDRFARARGMLPTADERGVNRGAAGAVSDLARLEILRQEGGHYMDSDNTPGADAASFAGMTSPSGLRLGFGNLGRGRTFSNDAMSAAPGNRFVDDYLTHSYDRLNADTAREITSRENARVSEAVMNTTGPRAMARVPLPTSQDEVAATAREMGDDYNVNAINISTFAQSSTHHEHRRLHPTLDRVFGRVGYGQSLFNRGFGNSWLEPRASDDDDKKGK